MKLVLGRSFGDATSGLYAVNAKAPAKLVVTVVGTLLAARFLRSRRQLPLLGRWGTRARPRASIASS